MNTLPRKFNPGLNQNDEDLIKQYVVRLPLLYMLLDTIKQNISSPICQHCLYFGPRGRGKTMLLTRVAAELRINPLLSKNWIPIRLLEESYYEISDIGEFWLEVMSELTLQLPNKHKEESEKTLEHLKENWDHPNLEQMAQSAVLNQLDSLKKKAIIMIENLHQLMDETESSKKAHDFGWKIRKIMQNEPRIMFLATATTRFDNLDNPKKPFFDIFDVSELPRLKRSEVAVLWNSLTLTNKTENEIAPLDILTGGSPRLLNIIAQFSKSNSIRELMENLTGLVDEYTEYFKSQMEALSPQERRIFLALADLWSESTAKEVSERARLDIRTTSTQLGRLVNKGAIKADNSNPKKKVYQIAERLFCIYYKLRRERNQDAVIEGLVQFMVDFYTPRELDKIRSLHLKKDVITKEEQSVLERLSANHEQRSTLVKYSRPTTTLENGKNNTAYNVIVNELEQVTKVIELNNSEKSIKSLKHAIKKYHAEKEPIIIHTLLGFQVMLAVLYIDTNSLDKAMEILDAIIKKYKSSKNPEILIHLILSMGAKSDIYKEQGEPEKAGEILEKVIKKYETSDDIRIQGYLARSSIFLAEIYEQKNSFDKAGEILEKVIKKYETSDDTLVIDSVRQSLFMLARLYRKQSNSEKAIEVLDTIIKKYKSSKNLENIKYTVKALLIQASLHKEQDNLEKAIEVFNTIIKKYKSSKNPEILEYVVKSKLQKAFIYQKQDDIKKATEVIELLIETHKSSKNPETLQSIALATVFLGVLYTAPDGSEKAIRILEKVIKKYKTSESSYFSDIVIQALSIQAREYTDQGNHKKAYQKYEDLITKYEAIKNPETVEYVIRALLNYGHLLSIKERYAEAKKIYQKALLYLEGNDFSEHSIYVSIASLGLLISEKAPKLPKKSRAGLSKIIENAEIKLTSEVRMEMALGVCAIFSTEIALSIIQNSENNASLAPIITSLQQEKGENIRVSEEILEVAADVRTRIDKLKKLYLGNHKSV